MEHHVVTFQGKVWNRGVLSMLSKEDDSGSIRIFYLRYFHDYFEDFDSVEDAEDFVRYLRTFYREDDGGDERTAGIFEGAINRDTGEDMTNTFSDIEGIDL